ncbi:MAG: MBL fold metallo-hydrolase [Opitutaceae bacterium]|nr:MBL fold metallo-hydrolase [Opitutaceae bacterium]
MRLTDLNREGGIGANSLYVEIDGFNLIIDSGLNPKLAGSMATPDFSIVKNVEIDLILITHCHLDHIGALPLLMQEHPEARTIMSQSSQMLIERMLHNSCNVMKRQRAEQNIHEYPLFTHDEVDRVSERFETVPFEEVSSFKKNGRELQIVLHQAGHIAGAGGVEIKSEDQRYFFTGDVLFDHQKTLSGARFPSTKRFDIVVLETTRGETERESGKTRESEVDRLLATTRNVLRRGGSVLIPVFALGRMQEILTIINEARKSGDIPKCPVFGAGLGLAVADHLDQISKRTGQAKFSRRTIKELRLRRPPRQLATGKEPPQQGIYIVSSGMLIERTPSYALAASLIAQGRNAICFVGYCDPDTPGGKLLETKPGEPFIFEALDYQTPIRAQIERFELSGHADREELLAFALSTRPNTIVLTHGDPGARAWFAEALVENEPTLKVVDPKPLQTINVS